jgi:heavy metal sensor kinase
LTLWYAALLAASIALLIAVLYVGLGIILRDNFDEQVRSKSALALTGIRFEAGEAMLDPGTAANLTDDEHFVRLTALDGRSLLDTSESLGGVPIRQEHIAAALAGRTELFTQSLPGDKLTVVAAPVRDSSGAAVAVLEVGQSRQDIEDVLRALLIVAAVATPFMLGLAAAGGYLLAGRALAPVDAITRLAAKIHGEELDARLNLDLPEDELGRLARTFDAMLARIERDYDRQRRFTADAAHELRTPLSLMRTQIDLALAKERPPAEYREALLGLDGDVRRMSELVAALLALARADTGRLPLQPARFALDATIGLVLEQQAGAAATAHVELRNEAAPAVMEADEDLIVQLLLNLTDNAVTATAPGGWVAAGCEAGDGVARLWVADNGAGIPAAELARVFDRFYRVDSGRTRGSGGLGLGLSICRAIVQAHQGTIALTSEPGRGTRVEVTLPSASSSPFHSGR